METGTISVSNTQNQAFTKRKPSPNFLKCQESNKESLITCSTSLILHTLSMTTENKNQGNHQPYVYMDEMLHSIFFLGYIYDSSLTPDMFFTKPTRCAFVKERFPEPFEKYKTHLPTRTPFSILLNMMEILHCTEEKIIKELLLLLKKLRFPNPLHKPGSKYEQYYTLESTVICVCYSDSDSQKYYGASLSCRKGNAKRILIDLSCLNTWHKFISHAVMSFHLRTSGDGITFPESVKCQAYFRDWNKNVYRKRLPCLNCKKLFNLPDADLDKVEHPYGNCAETECLSKLLFNNQHIRENTLMENYTVENFETLTGLTKASLTTTLAQAKIHMNENFLFYSPMQ